MSAISANAGYQEVVNPETGRMFRWGESDHQLLGYPRWVVITAAWVCMCMAGLLEYTWAALSGSLQAAHHWGDAPVFWLFSFYVVFESFVQIATGFARNHGILPVKRAVIIGGALCGIICYAITAYSTNIWEAYFGYAFLGGVGSGMVYSSCINIVAKWYPDKKGWRTGFVNGGFAYGAVPWIIAIGGFSSATGIGHLSSSAVKEFILIQGAAMTAIIFIAAQFMKDPPRNWWPAHVDPLGPKSKRTQRDLASNPIAWDHYSLRQMWNTPQSKWLAAQYALFVGCSLFGVAYYYVFGTAMHLSSVAVVAGAAGFALADGGFRPIYGLISEYVGRRRVMYTAYSLNVVFQGLTLVAGLNHIAWLFAVSAVISGGLSGANFPMTAATVADYYGENNNAVNYGSIYAFKALGGSFAGGFAALIMTGTLYGHAHFHWAQGFIFGMVLGALAAIIVYFKCKRPTKEEWQAAVAKAAEADARKGRKGKIAVGS